VIIAARPVNPADLFSIAGVYPGFAPQVFPATPGLEGAGVVEDANSSDKVKNGQRVVAFVDAISGQGSWQEYVCIPDTSVLPIPDSVSDASAAQFVVNPGLFFRCKFWIHQ
jgi:NADPH:quinone reductase-like Zn-dependent oxidoreductase